MKMLDMECEWEEQRRDDNTMSEQERDKKFEEIYKDAPTKEPERQYYFMEQARNGK